MPYLLEALAVLDVKLLLELETRYIAYWLLALNVFPERLLDEEL